MKCARISVLREYKKIFIKENIFKKQDFFIRCARTSVLKELEKFYGDFYFMVKI